MSSLEELSVIADQFINAITANRSGKIKNSEWKSGKMFFAKDAQRIGLIDGIKTFSQIVKRMEFVINQPKQTGAGAASSNMGSKPSVILSTGNNNIVADNKTIVKPSWYKPDGSESLAEKYLK